MKSIFRNDSVEIFLHKEDKILIQRWSSKYPIFAEFKEGIDKTVEFFKQYNPDGLLADTSVQPSIGNDSLNYSKSSIPDLVENGMRRMAFVMPEKFFFRRIINNFTHATDENKIRRFESEDKAVEWLLS